MSDNWKLAATVTTFSLGIYFLLTSVRELQAINKEIAAAVIGILLGVWFIVQAYQWIDR